MSASSLDASEQQSKSQLDSPLLTSGGFALIIETVERTFSKTMAGEQEILGNLDLFRRQSNGHKNVILMSRFTNFSYDITCIRCVFQINADSSGSVVGSELQGFSTRQETSHPRKASCYPSTCTPVEWLESNHLTVDQYTAKPTASEKLQTILSIMVAGKDAFVCSHLHSPLPPSREVFPCPPSSTQLRLAAVRPGLCAQSVRFWVFWVSGYLGLQQPSYIRALRCPACPTELSINARWSSAALSWSTRALSRSTAALSLSNHSLSACTAALSLSTDALSRSSAALSLSTISHSLSSSSSGRSHTSELCWCCSGASLNTSCL